MPSSTWKKDLPLKITNVVTYLIFLSSNAYSSLVPRDSKYGAGPHETYVTPQSWIFLVWPLIHLHLLGMIIIQFFDVGHDAVIKVIGWRFPVLAVLTSVYAGLNSATSDHAGHHDSRVYAICAFITLLLTAGVISHIYRDLKLSSVSSNRSSRSWLEFLFVDLPFSLYHGFIVVLLVLSAFNAFGVNANTHHHAGVITKILVFFALLFLEATAAGYVFYGKGDIGGASVICLSLLAIFQHQTRERDAFIHWSALAFFIISLIAVLRATIAAFRGGRMALTDEERAPLVG